MFASLFLIVATSTTIEAFTHVVKAQHSVIVAVPAAGSTCSNGISGWISKDCHNFDVLSSSSSLQMVMAGSGSARDLLYQDQQVAMERRALKEEELMGTDLKELKAPKLKPKPPKSGKGFGGGKSSNDYDDSIGARLAVEQAKVIKRDGVLRISNVLSDELVNQLRQYVLKQQEIAAFVVKESGNDLKVSKSFYGVENARQSRCDLQLSLMRGGYARDNGSESNSGTSEQEPHTVADVLYELLGKDGTLRHLYENLVTPQGEFYELAATITDPGSKRQQVHPDLPFQKEAPLYVIFLALQDVTKDMGPTSFLLKTHNNEVQTKKFMSGDVEKNKILEGADCRLSTLKKGEAVLFDARVLHCGNANQLETGSTRVLFNLSFRNPQVQGNLGYPGSIRPGYCGAMTLDDVSKRIDEYYQINGNNVGEPFAEYGTGLVL